MEHNTFWSGGVKLFKHKCPRFIFNVEMERLSDYNKNIYLERKYSRIQNHWSQPTNASNKYNKTMKQMVKGFTHKSQDKVMDCFFTFLPSSKSSPSADPAVCLLVVTVCGQVVSGVIVCPSQGPESL